MKLFRVMEALWCEPWLIMPSMHARLCDIAAAHQTGIAHGDDGIVAQFMETKREEERPKYKQVGNVAIIPVDGVIGKRLDSMTKSSGATDVDAVGDMLDRALSDATVEGIMLDVNSPGGTVSGVPELAGRIAAATAIKPVVAYTDELMASAAYYLAAGADGIFAAPSANVGSIGVYMAWLDESRRFELEGVRTELVKSGKFKAMGIRGLSINAEERALLQAGVDKVAGWFRGHVREHRAGMPEEAMEGQTLYADDAIANDMIDGVTDPDGVMQELQDLIGQRRK